MTGDLLDVETLASLPDRHVTALREALHAAAYDARILGQAEGIAPRQLDAVRLPLVQAWLAAQPGPAAVLARLFAYRDLLGRDDVLRALGPELGAALEDCGVLAPVGERVRSRLRLLPFGGIWIGSDDADARFDPVMGPGATTQELLRALPGVMPARVLDVGCGAGSLALAAARSGATAVTAVDLDPRAVALTEWNARLNALTVTAKTGDLLAPIGDARFDLVIAQPPFVPQPPDLRATTYLHGGSRGDELALRLLSELPGALAPGGRALILMDTAPLEGQLALDRIRAALPRVPLQVSAVSARGHDRHQLALGYAAAADSTLGSAYADAARRYLAHLEALGIESTRHVLLVLRKPVPDEPTWAISVEPRGAAPYDATRLEHLEAGLALATLAPEDLRACRVRPPEGSRLVQSHPLDGSEGELRFVCPGGRAPDQDLSDAAARLIELALQADSVAALIDAYAEACEDAPERVEEAVLDFLRKALVSGLLEPYEDPDEDPSA